MRKKMELEGKTGEVESIMEEQGKVRVRMDCGRRVLVSLERMRVQEVEHMKGAEDSKTTQQQHQGKETKGRGVTVDHELHGRKEKTSEEGEMGGQEETFELWNGVRLVGMRQSTQQQLAPMWRWSGESRQELGSQRPQVAHPTAPATSYLGLLRGVAEGQSKHVSTRQHREKLVSETCP